MTEINNQLNLKRHHPFARWLTVLNEVQSFLARLTLNCDLDIAYGKTSGQKLDIFPAKNANSPVFVFIHGGYFRALDKRQYSFLARHLTNHFTVVLLNYDLCPKVKIKDIIEQNRNALEWISLNINRWNGDKDNLCLCGHSVGAFLVASLMDPNWKTSEKLIIREAILLSGIYDLLPLQQSYLNDSLYIEDEDVKYLSPISNNIYQPNKLTIAVGSNETEIFKSQSKEYASYLGALGLKLKHIEISGKNHYSAVRALKKLLNESSFQS
ncbi:MAG: alpha/beta hydrolase [Kangiellaceae bacterium]|nr:alpha/beta hydrolase [Kangiellaceae bacterium]MCW9018407.1 alpha/beta hydrolase [Kangiellaceae bacterium]